MKPDCMFPRDGQPCIGYRLASSQLADMVRGLREIAGNCPCTCAPEYHERGLIAPDCLAALAGDDARRALGDLPNCLGAIAARRKALDEICRIGQEFDTAPKEPKT